MRLLVLGAGGIGGYFGARLLAAGVDVRFLVRPARAVAMARDGLVLRSPLGDLALPAPVVTAAPPETDAVLLACKAFDLPAAMAAISPAVGARTLVLPLLNGLRHLDLLDEAFGPARVLGGLAHIGVTLGPAGEVLHLNRLQVLMLAARTAAQAAPAAALHAVLARGGFAPELAPDILQAMWEKFVFLSAYAGMTCLMRAPLGAILAAEEGTALLREAYAEGVAVAAAAGHAPSAEAQAAALSTLTEAGSRGTASMLRDLQAGARTEHAHILGDMLARARRAGIASPLLRVALAHLQAAEALRRE